MTQHDRSLGGQDVSMSTILDKAYTTFFCIQRWGWGWSAYTWYTH